MYCLKLYWVLGKSISDGKWYYCLSFKWWKKGSNYLTEIKYHLLRYSKVHVAIGVVKNVLAFIKYY